MVKLRVCALLLGLVTAGVVIYGFGTSEKSLAARTPSLLKLSDAKAVCETQSNRGYNIPACIQGLHRSGITVLSDEFVTPEFVKRYQDAIITSVSSASRTLIINP